MILYKKNFNQNSCTAAVKRLKNGVKTSNLSDSLHKNDKCTLYSKQEEEVKLVQNMYNGSIKINSKNFFKFNSY